MLREGALRNKKTLHSRDSEIKVLVKLIRLYPKIKQVTYNKSELL